MFHKRRGPAALLEDGDLSKGRIQIAYPKVTRDKRANVAYVALRSIDDGKVKTMTLIWQQSGRQGVFLARPGLRP